MPEILLGSEIFTDWTRESEYKFCGAKLGGYCNVFPEKNTILDFGWCLISIDFCL